MEKGSLEQQGKGLAIKTDDQSLFSGIYKGQGEDPPQTEDLPQVAP